MLFNPINHAVFSLPYRAFAGVGSVVVLWTSLIILIFPAVKITVGGLYTASVADVTVRPTMTLDTSLVDQFENSYNMNLSIVNGIIERASRWSEWSQISTFNLPSRTGVVDDLVFTNLTGSLANITSVQAIIPAIKVDVHCTRHDNDDFSLWVSQVHNDYWGEDGLTPNVMFRPKTANVNATGVSLVDYYAISMMQNSVTAPNYIGQAFLPANSNQDLYPDSQYNLVLADYSTVTGGVRNLTYVPAVVKFDDTQTVQNIAVPAKPGMFNVSLPTVRSVVCSRSFNKVSVNVTLVESTRAGLDGSSTKLPWAVSAYDPTSITGHTAFGSSPAWMFPDYPAASMAEVAYDNIGNMNAASSGGNNAELVSGTLWPDKGTSSNIFEALAAYAEFQAHNISSLLDVNGLAEAAEAVLTSYSVQLLSELRAYTTQLSNVNGSGHSTSVISVQAHGQKPAIKQSPGITYAIVTMLSIVIVCAILAASAHLPLPGRRSPGSRLRGPPGSIAAAMALLAGSRLVRELREQDIRRTDQTDIWSHRFRLGWWDNDVLHSPDERDRTPESLPIGETGEEGQRRWGIDLLD